MKKLILLFAFTCCIQWSSATIHVVRVWDGYFQFLPSQVMMELGDTIQWLPLDPPSMPHTVTSTNIPSGAISFDVIWQLPADTFFQYVPTELGTYIYECTPHAVSFGMIGAFIVNSPTGIPENAINPVFVSPNPATNEIELANKPVQVPFRVIDISGKILVERSDGSKVDLSSFQKGLYFVEILFDKPQVIKFLKE